MHALLEPGAVWVGPARLRGRLYDLGHFPGLADGRSGDWVQGELYRLTGPDPARLLASLDRYEGRAFRREVREAESADATRVEAYVYLFAGSLRGRRRIASGDYLADPRSPSRAAPAGRRA
jgi:gamma-glutamylcyclotransferase (GGCT)/AIG2-like uncharacterized protein YtfP